MKKIIRNIGWALLATTVLTGIAWLANTSMNAMSAHTKLITMGVVFLLSFALNYLDEKP